MPKPSIGVAILTADDDARLDPAVIAALYVDHAEQLRRFLMGVLRDWQLVSDVLQATFVKAIESGHTSKEESRKSWLFRVAYNEAMAIRRREAVGRKAIERLAWTRPTGGETADAPAIRWESVRAVRSAMQKLPKPQRRIVWMRIHEQKTFAQIAGELDIPLGTALSRMRAALAKLREYLASEQQS